MSKGERTREQVIEKAAGLFNQLGYQATSISDVMLATGLKKGGIYRHFESKDELALAAFDFAVNVMTERFAGALAKARGPADKLRALVSVYERIPTDPPVPGGCPLLNASVEADDAHPQLRQRAQEVMDGLRNLVRATLRKGQAEGALRADVNPEQFTSAFVATLEGAVMLAKLYGTKTHMQHVVAHLNGMIDAIETRRS